MIKKVFYSALLSSLLTSPLLHAEAEDCLDWEINTHRAGENLSSCAYFNSEKVSTRFVVKNHCATTVRGIFSYYREIEASERVMSVQPFQVPPGDSAEVANPCDVAADWSYYVTQAD